MNNSNISDLLYLKSAYYLSLQFGGARTAGKKKKRWSSLIHNGVVFAPEYEPHKVPLLYKKEKIILNPEAEEMATIYAKYIDTEYPKNGKFNKNFWHDWKKLLSPDLQKKIISFDDCDFSLIQKYILKIKEEKKSVSKEKKEADKKKKDLEEKKYKTAILDGKEQPVGNYKMEPPGIFIGRS